MLNQFIHLKQNKNYEKKFKIYSAKQRH
jgi:hypothetical protein